jgi:hypothetical protein
VRTVQQDLQVYKQLKLKEGEVGSEETAKRVNEEFTTVWGKHLGDIYHMLSELQADDEDSKLMFNCVKNVTKSFQDSQDAKNKAKIANGFKCLISKVVREFVQMLSYKIQVYLSGNNSN